MAAIHLSHLALAQWPRTSRRRGGFRRRGAFSWLGRVDWRILLPGEGWGRVVERVVGGRHVESVCATGSKRRWSQLRLAEKFARGSRITAGK